MKLHTVSNRLIYMERGHSSNLKLKIVPSDHEACKLQAATFSLSELT
jgi:hypothetical protein